MIEVTELRSGKAALGQGARLCIGRGEDGSRNEERRSAELANLLSASRYCAPAAEKGRFRVCADLGLRAD